MSRKSRALSIAIPWASESADFTFCYLSFHAFLISSSVARTLSDFRVSCSRDLSLAERNPIRYFTFTRETHGKTSFGHVRFPTTWFPRLNSLGKHVVFFGISQHTWFPLTRRVLCPLSGFSSTRPRSANPRPFSSPSENSGGTNSRRKSRLCSTSSNPSPASKSDQIFVQIPLEIWSLSIYLERLIGVLKVKSVGRVADVIEGLT